MAAATTGIRGDTDSDEASLASASTSGCNSFFPRKELFVHSGTLLNLALPRVSSGQHGRGLACKKRKLLNKNDSIP